MPTVRLHSSVYELAGLLLLKWVQSGQGKVPALALVKSSDTRDVEDMGFIFNIARQRWRRVFNEHFLHLIQSEAPTSFTYCTTCKVGVVVMKGQ